MEKDIPVQKNHCYNIEIKDLSHKGQGVGDYQGFTLFVPDAIPGDKVKVKIVKVSKNYAIGKLIKVLAPSANRILEKCPVARNCGGCQIQNMAYEAQLKYKTRLVEQNIERIGGLKGITVHKCIGMKDPWRYRNKVQFPVGIRSGKAIVGFYAAGSHDIIPTESCIIQHQSADEVLKIIKNFIDEYNIEVYDETLGEGLIKHIIIRIGFSTNEIMVILVINGKELPYCDKLVELIKDKLPFVKTIVLNINTEKTNVIMGRENIIVYGKGKISERLGDLEFSISPLSFFQVNSAQAEVLYEKAVQYAELSGDETVFDLYSGTGTISLFMAKKAGKVYGIEVVKDAVMDARENARINNITNAEFVVGAAEDVVPKLYKKGMMADIVVVDPPRKGCAPSLLDTIIKMNPKKVIYISCNPSTLARDICILANGGYQVHKIQPVDLFPHTMHVECVVLMSRL
ncbi:MAG TPA: 23S rRNA (uracil(1939)-C(5))-methyltransferase RlmD [Thermoanaerobacterales bacterium]|nr:23S rRNA (uracil(1939)-C(5))-methyltransferase RlmD [Thermoanaerobacterales bacterium]